jgi:hypothetical protein
LKKSSKIRSPQNEEPRSRAAAVSSCIGNFYICFMVHTQSEDSTFLLNGKKIPPQSSGV